VRAGIPGQTSRPLELLGERPSDAVGISSGRFLVAMTENCKDALIQPEKAESGFLDSALEMTDLGINRFELKQIWVNQIWA
jgi:hypothetical protein